MHNLLPTTTKASVLSIAAALVPVDRVGHPAHEAAGQAQALVVGGEGELTAPRLEALRRRLRPVLPHDHPRQVQQRQLVLALERSQRWNLVPTITN